MLIEKANVLTGAKPTVSPATVLKVLRQHWNLENVKITPLNSERDQNFQVDGPDGRFVLKIANPAEPFSITQLQTQALTHIAATDPSIPVPRVIPTQNETTEISLSGSTVRLLSWMNGVPWHLTQRSAAQRRSIAEGHARLVLALASFSSNEPPSFLQWDVQHVSKLADRLDAVPAECREGVDIVLERFAAIAAPALKNLPRQYGHNDMQPHNIVVDENDHTRMSGILDFGDMVLTPVACDLGVACAYNAVAGDHPFQTVGEYVAAFNAIRPLSDAEIQVLPILTMARLATTIIIASWRASLYHDNANYVLRNRPAAIAGLSQLLTLSHDTAVEYLRKICR
jgi:hydroxylysine kinase